LVDGWIGLGIVIATEDVVIRWVDVGGIGLLMDGLGFPAEWDE